MSLPQRIYQIYREVVACDLVKTRKATPESILQFQTLLNKAFPENEVETHQRALVRSMYNSSPVGFYSYIYQNRSRVGALSLWTESRCLAKFFRLNRVVYISFNETTQQYTVVQYVPREKNFKHRDDSSLSQSIETSQPGTFRRDYYVSRTFRNLRRFNNGVRSSNALKEATQENPTNSTLESSNRVTFNNMTTHSTEPVVESWATTQ